MPDVPDYDDRPSMDETDTKWVDGFIGGDKGIPEGSIIEGFFAVISYIRPDGERDWRPYNTIDAPLSNILGLLQMAGFTYMHENLRERE